MSIKFITLLLAIGVCSITSSCSGQQSKTISAKEKTLVIGKTIALLQQHYLFPERAKKVDEYVNQKLNNGGYDSVNKLIDFLTGFENDIRQQANDQHLELGLSPERVKQILTENKNEKEEKEEEFAPEWTERMKFENFRLRKVERLEGNIGYLNFLNFAPLKPAKETITGAMNFIRFSSSVIIDLRDNGGGYSETMEFLLSYFLKDSTQIAELRHRKNNKIEKTYTVKDLAINKIPESIPVFILVNNKTSSAAEGFAYTLQQYKRATIIGEQTKGEGNPGELFVINDYLYIMIPTIEGINPVSKKSIDGIGVTPDIQISSGNALNKALLVAYSQLGSQAKIKELKLLYQWLVPFYENELNPQMLTQPIVNYVVGNYEGGRKVFYENNSVFYNNGKGSREKLEYMSNGVFQHSEKKFLRLIMPTTTKPVSYFEWIWGDGGEPQKVKRISE